MTNMLVLAILASVFLPACSSDVPAKAVAAGTGECTGNGGLSWIRARRRVGGPDTFICKNGAQFVIGADGSIL